MSRSLRKRLLKKKKVYDLALHREHRTGKISKARNKVFSKKPRRRAACKSKLKQLGQIRIMTRPSLRACAKFAGPRRHPIVEVANSVLSMAFGIIGKNLMGELEIPGGMNADTEVPIKRYAFIELAETAACG
jgi:hypothetical protein